MFFTLEPLLLALSIYRLSFPSTTFPCPLPLLPKMPPISLNDFKLKSKKIMAPKIKKHNDFHIKHSNFYTWTNDFWAKVLDFQPKNLKYQNSSNRFRGPTTWSSKTAAIAFWFQVMKTCLREASLRALLLLIWSLYWHCSCQMPNPSGREAANLSEGQVEPVTLATGTWSLPSTRIFIYAYITPL